MEDLLDALIRLASELNDRLRTLNIPVEIRTAILIMMLLEKYLDDKSLVSPVQKNSVELLFDRFDHNSKSELILLAAYYIYGQGTNQFTANDIHKILLEARIAKIPANISDYLNKLASRKRWFISLGIQNRQKIWTISRLGQKFVEDKLSLEN